MDRQKLVTLKFTAGRQVCHPAQTRATNLCCETRQEVIEITFGEKSDQGMYVQGSASPMGNYFLWAAFLEIYEVHKILKFT
jgi:hypothetical protein